MEIKITKGEWVVEQTEPTPNKLDLLITANDVKLGWLYSNTIEAEANAKLIAASPDMLEALEWSLTQFKRLADMGRYPEFMLQKNGGQGVMPIVKAIEKATKQ